MRPRYETFRSSTGVFFLIYSTNNHSLYDKINLVSYRMKSYETTAVFLDQKLGKLNFFLSIQFLAGFVLT